MTHDEAFLADIIANPDDLGLRQIYADWLEERGDVASLARAEFIRLQIQMADPAVKGPRFFKLRARAQKLLRIHEKAWAAPIPDLVWRYEFRRGFIEAVTVKPDAFLLHAGVLFRSAPVRHLTFLGFHEDLPQSPYLARISTLEFDCYALGRGNAPSLLASPHLATLRELRFGSIDIGLEGIKALAEQPHLCRLERLALHSNHLDAEKVGTLCASPHLYNLTALDLRQGITLDGLRALASAPSASRLTELLLGTSYLGDEGPRVLVESPYLSRLTHLDLSGNRLTDVGAALLAQASNLSKLTRLYLQCNAITPAGKALLRQRFGEKGVCIF